MENLELAERIVSVDLGFSHTKGRRGLKKFRQPSVIGVPRRLYNQDVRETDIILGSLNKDDDNFVPKYFIGDLALRKSNTRHYSKGDDKANTWTTEILLSSALSALSSNDEEILLITGLPIDFYFKQKEIFEQFFRDYNNMEAHAVKFGNGVPKIAKPTIIKTVVTVQPMGAAMKYLLDENGQFKDKTEATKLNIVGDIGFHTFDLLVLDGMEIHRYSHSDKEISISTAYTSIQDWLKDETGSAPDLYELDYHIRKGDYYGIDLTGKFIEAMGNLARQAKLALERLNLNYNKYISTGGWAEIITPMMELPKVSTVIYDQDGNIDGYDLIGVRACQAR